jgi:xanthine dehydrogenase YagS FAD-binding subunit
MATLRDIMPPFELYQPENADDAVRLLARLGAGAWVLAGGLDSLEWFKDRAKRPLAVVDLGRIPELRGVREAGQGLEIGAMTTLAQVAAHPLVRERFPMLAQAAGEAASPQIRNQGTLGGNVSQDARCWYYRSGWACYRAGGNLCYADTPQGMTREHAIFGADRCVAVSPSDTAPAMVALGARMVVKSARGEREVPAEEYFIGPGHDITRMTMLSPGDLLTAVRIPADWAKAEQRFVKVRERRVWDFPLVNLACALVESGGRIERLRLALGAVAAHPWRLAGVEAALRGKARDAAAAELAGRLAAEGAQPLAHNAYKVDLVRNLVRRAVLGKEEA